MSDSKKGTNEDKEDQYLKDMKNNGLLFEQKLQKLKKKAKELKQTEKDKIKNQTKILNRTAEIKYPTTNEKSLTLNSNKKNKINTKSKISSNTISNTNNKIKNIYKTMNNNLSRQESKEIKSYMNQDNSINNDVNSSYSNIYYTLDDDFFNDTSIRKDYKIKELIKKNKQLKNEIEYKNTIIESMEKQIELLKQKKDIDDNTQTISQNKIDEINFELGKLTREVEEKNQKIENYEINNKNLNIKIENLMMQNKNLSNREKRIIDQNEYLSTNMDKLKDDNENQKKKIMKLEKLNQNLLKDYEELSNNYNKLKSQKEKIQSFSEEQKAKISELNKEIKDLNNLLKESLNQQKQNKSVRFEENDDSEDEYENEYNNRKRRKRQKSSNRYDKYHKMNENYDDSDSDDNGNYNDYDNYGNKYSNNKNFNKTSSQFYNRNRRDFNDEYDDNNNNNTYLNRMKGKNFNTLNAHEDERRYSQAIPSRISQMKQRKKNRNYYENDNQDDMYNGAENDEYMTHNYSTRNIFSGNKSVKRKLGEYINDNSSRKRLNGKQIKDPRTKEYLDYDGYEGFNCFPCERKEKKNKLIIDELNNDLNELIRNKNIMENKLLNLPGQSKSISNIRQKKELNYKIQQSEMKINEIRIKLKKLKGL